MDSLFFFFTLAAAVRAEGIGRQLVSKTQDEASAVRLFGRFCVGRCGDCGAEQWDSFDKRVCTILLHSF